MTDFKRIRIRYDKGDFQDDEVDVKLSELADAICQLVGGNHGVVSDIGNDWEEVHLTCPTEKVGALMVILEGWTLVDAVEITGDIR